MRAIKVIFLIWTDPKRGLAKKRILQRDAFEGETYCEAIPTTAILSFIILYSRFVNASSEDREPPLLLIVGSDNAFFAVTYATSFLSATLGLSKAFTTGPCKILPEGVSCRFLLLFFASFFTLVTKFCAIAAVLIFSLMQDDIKDIAIVFPIATVLMPGLVTALVSTWHCKMLKTFLHHPSFFILPVFTYFTFSSSNKVCEGETHIRFSTKASLCNILFSVVGFFVYAVFIQSHFGSAVVSVAFWAFFAILFLPQFFFFAVLIIIILLLNIVLSLVFICNSPTKTAVEYGVFKPDNPTEAFTLSITADGSERVLSSDDQAKQAEEFEL